jgi:hypothetical protein
MATAVAVEASPVSDAPASDTRAGRIGARLAVLEARTDPSAPDCRSSIRSVLAMARELHSELSFHNQWTGQRRKVRTASRRERP